MLAWVTLEDCWESVPFASIVPLWRAIPTAPADRAARDRYPASVPSRSTASSSTDARLQNANRTKGAPASRWS
ncbi:hypothetical protein GCM10010515_36850 [Streptomyces fructofermentans]|uniref:Uncharacterized protein n=1 Tax=Streptomyces fructofermentans TaxID=152141 RepID=A0A918KJX6_9ACTN|nr:hypothetical protein GCM10010515_36850 [Streptomyces fructofermentans]